MTDDRTLAALDQRARAAAAGVRTAVAERPAPVFDPDVLRIDIDARGDRPERPSRSRPVVAVLAAAAAVLVVVAAVVALTGTGDPDSAPADREEVGEARRYVLGEAPEGYVLSSVLDTDETLPFDPGSDQPIGAVAVYGPDARTPRLGVLVYPPDPGAPEAAPPSLIDEQLEVEVSGRRAWEVDEEFVRNGIVVEVDGAFVVVAGAAAERAELVAVAAIVEADGDRATVPEGLLPDGLAYLGRAHYLDLVAGIDGLRSIEAGDRIWTVAYVQPGPDGEPQGLIAVSAARGDAVRVRAPMLATTDVEDVTVRGHDGLLARTTFQPTGPVALTLTWEERPGEIVQVGGVDTLGEDVLLDLAEGLRTIEADDLPALRREAMETAASGPGVTVVGRGTFATGDDWVLLHHADTDSTTIETTATDGGSSSTFAGSGTAVDADGDPVPNDDALRDGIGYGGGPDGAWAYGLLAADVAEVSIRGAGVSSPPVTIVEGSGLRGWVAELPASPGSDVPAYEIRALAADGTVLQTREISS